ncbi:NAD(P)/FAD-dependent oxidoreductase [Bradyrhizobium sp. AUGA SZCCT0283]|uniref:flavin monoamine oxidase family protein n=1 Tax=Bradyrhizobium sp. AUGA SZCCT0283 TaxID=2807671 RepID=UPI001BA9CDD5|nr:NAD(P)/FAD-dependent oxidoreductase [Bradyrhizobium sp. AUGA SZCCT0283]MBR1279398.1 FAD-dependent oxidoreductase [Bradyrhizobium sp. AUGA SZCCT0283]
MLDAAIIGGGVCGVVLARSLHRQGRAAALFEARGRLGGRILSVASAGSELTADLGPTWFWPDTQPLMKSLVAELGLPDIPQHDDGSVLHLNDPEKIPERIEGKAIHEGARRLQGGMAQLVDLLAADLPPNLSHLNHVLTSIGDRGDHVVLTFAAGDTMVEFRARHVVLAIPPRLLEQHVRFEPGLDEATREAMRSAQTWMAAQAKVVVAYDRAYWREAGHSGNAFVTHGQAVVGEIFDACDCDPERAALGGFLALSPGLRASFSAGLPLLIDNQIVQLFGSALEHGEQHYQDWATEPYTCSALDRTSAQTEQHADIANPMLRRVHWNGKLYLGGSETASRGAGYLEGALEAARRIDLLLKRKSAQEKGAAYSSAGDGNAGSVNAASLTRFGAWVAAQGDAAFDGYRHRLHRSLAAQQHEQLTQRAILEAIEEVFDNALAVLDGLDFDIDVITVERGRSSLTPAIQQPFGDLMQSVLDDVVAFNRTSCALSNFPDEHHLSREYTQVIMRDIAAAWLEFSLAANRLLLAKADVRDRRLQATKMTGVSS